jgi:NAD(P)-dependent dehydrogenase (short-subunit alcohol dehydrogenase family)
VLRDKTFHNMTTEDFDFVVKVHFQGTAYVTHAAWPILRAKAYGRVVVTSSNSGIYGTFGQANYGGAKLAVVGFMNALRLEGQKYNIMINALAPVAATRMTESLMTPEVLDKLRPEFVSPMVAYLCSEQCQRTGDIWSAGAGTFARIEYREAEGVRINGRAPTPEDVAENIEKIADVSASRVFRTSGEEVAAVVGS